ncbi:MAG: LysM peptidoglycan-binding domain-containing protein [Bacilli bacterium]|nr:LysM peptidoglycan-binding domain-containing protein [Bacilli bacterium]
MNLTIPFSKEIVFKSKIAEINSISLEHDISINESELLGDFIISGDYKNLDINVDTIPFSHIVPFSVNLDDDIDIDSLTYDVVDFNYEINNEDILKVNISLHVEAEKKISEKLDIFEEVKEDLNRDDLVLDIKEEINQEDLQNEVDIKDENVDEKTSLILSDDLKEDYITYHVHLVKIDETIDKICSEYKISKEELTLINDTSTINVGDKLIIPINNDKEE